MQLAPACKRAETAAREVGCLPDNHGDAGAVCGFARLRVGVALALRPPMPRKSLRSRLIAVSILAAIAGIVAWARRPETPPQKLTVVALLEARAYALDGFLGWLRDHRGCPERLGELDRYLHRTSSLDPWGTPYQFRCGDGALGLPVRSAGPDQTFDTRDDIVSDWYFRVRVSTFTPVCSADTHRCN